MTVNHELSICLAHLLARLALLSAMVLTSATGSAFAQSDSLTHAEKMTIANRIGVMLEERYVFPDVATKCAEHLKTLVENGAFKDCTDPEKFSARLAEALQEVSHDKHMLIRTRSLTETGGPGKIGHPLREQARRRSRDQERNFGFEKVERLEGNIGYLDLRYFARPGDAQATAVAAMAFLENTDAVIFDMRRNEGGYPGMVQFMCSYLFDQRTHLNSLYFREGDRTEEYWTLEGVPGKRMPKVPVFVLTSSTTFSGAEEFSYNLSTQKRGTLVGETTRGGANPGGVFPINSQFEMIIPTGRAINPITGTNWEGTGVEPHVSVAADLALEAALELAVPAAETYRAARQASWDALETALLDAARLSEEKKSEDAALALTTALDIAHKAGLLEETDINMLGYDYLGQKRHALAIAAFSFNVESFPRSANTYDSLGEAFRSAGDIERSIVNYERAIELDPKGPNAEAARAALIELKAELPSQSTGQIGDC